MSKTIKTINSVSGHGYKPSKVLLISCLVVFCCVCTFTDRASAATYYLDAVNGNDSNPGTNDQPWKTLTKAKSTVSAGDVVNLKAGNYGTASWTKSDTCGSSWDSPVTYQSDSAGASYCASFDRITVDRTGAANPNCYLIFSGIDVNIPPNNDSGIKVAYANQVKVLNCKVHAANPNGGGGDVNGPYNPNLVVISYGRNVLVEDCDIYNSGGDGVGIYASLNVTFRNNLVHDVTDSGIGLKASPNTILEYNRIYNAHNTWGAVWEPNHQGGSGISCRSDNTVIRGNIIWNDPGNDGIWGSRTLWVYPKPKSLVPPIDWSSDPNGWHDITIENNLVYNGGHWTEFSSVNQSWVIRNNTFGENVIITLAKNANGSGLTLYNNIFTGGMHLDSYGNATSSPRDSNWVNVNEGRNVYFRLTSTGNGYLWYYNEFKSGSDSICIRDANNNYKQGYNSTYFDIGKFFAGKSGEWPYKLYETSPAIAFANENYAPSIDILGNSRDSSPDAGCYEYASQGNNAPVLQAVGNKSVNENITLSFSVSASDADDDTITYSATGLPTGATFAGGTFNWTPTYSQAGTYQVTFTASDGKATVSETITITVNNVNRAPVLGSIGSKSVNENSTLSFSISATDADAGTITYSAGNLPAGAAFAARTFTWTPGYNQAGTHQVTFTASDGQDEDSETVTITVNNVNRPPVLSTPGNKSVYTSESLTFTVNASDPDGGTITYSAFGLPSGAGFNTSTKTFSWTPSQSQAGSYQVTFTASDGQLQDSETITITVYSTDTTAPNVTGRSPAVNSIQVPLNNLIILHIVDTGKGVDANSVTITVNNNIVYTGNTTHYDSTYGDCYRTGTKADYTFTYQPDNPFDYDQTVTVSVNAADLCGNVISNYSYPFNTEMRSFGANKKVNSGSDSLNDGGPAAARDSKGNIWAAWHSGQTGSRDIYIGKLTAGADNFGNSLQLTTNAADQCNPAIAIGSNDKLYVVWQDNQRGKWDIYASTSADGVSWSSEIKVSDPNSNHINPAITVTSNNAYIAWQDDQAGNQDIYVASSGNDFLTRTISRVTSDSSDQVEPAITADSENTGYVVWTDTRNGSNDIYGAASNNGPWTNVAIVSNAHNQSAPALAAEAAGTILHLLWVDDTSGNRNIYYASSNALPSNPLTGSNIIDDTSGADQIEPAIAVTGSTGSNLKVFACWQDKRSADTDLYFAEVSSAGRINVLVGDDGTNTDQSQPAIGTNIYGHPYLVWSDSRNTNSDIYYAGSTFVESSALTSKDVPASLAAIVGTAPESISGVNDVSIIVPQGAYPCNIKITVSRVKNPPKVTLERFSFPYDFGPSGIEFTKPVTITIPYEVSGSGSSISAYWYDPLTATLSQQGITDIKDVEISPTLHALSFKTTHFTEFFVGSGGDDGGSGGGGGGGGGGGCSMSANGQGGIAEFLLPYLALALVITVIKCRDARNRKACNITKSDH